MTREGSCREMRDRNVTPHVSQNTNRPGGSAHRWAHDTACRIPGEPAQAETDRRSIWVVKDGGNAAQDATPRSLQSWLGVHLRGRRLQSGADAEPCSGSLRISSGRSVPEDQESRRFGHTNSAKTHDKLVGERQEASPSNFFTSLLRPNLRASGDNRNFLRYNKPPMSKPPPTRKQEVGSGVDDGSVVIANVAVRKPTLSA